MLVKGGWSELLRIIDFFWVFVKANHEVKENWKFMRKWKLWKWKSFKKRGKLFTFSFIRQDFPQDLKFRGKFCIFYPRTLKEVVRRDSKSLPLVIHWLAGACWAGGWAGAAPNMSANGLPNCKRSSSALVCCWGAAAWSAAPKKSTILPEPPGGEARKGFVPLVGEPSFDWERLGKFVNETA
jgi:hypothetical protein